MAAKGKRAVTPANRPEHKIGPFHGGLGVSIWLNTVETDKGPRVYRSVTVAPRRYRDTQSGNWKDAKSYRPLDLSTLILALQAARDYCTKVPLPGQPIEGEEMEDLHMEDGDVNGDSTPPRIDFIGRSQTRPSLLGAEGAILFCWSDLRYAIRRPYRRSPSPRVCLVRDCWLT